MAVTVRWEEDKQNYIARGMPAGSKVLTFFGIMFIIFGVITMLSGDLIPGLIISTLGNIMIFISRKHQNSVQQRKANEALVNSKQTKSFSDGWEN